MVTDDALTERHGRRRGNCCAAPVAVSYASYGQVEDRARGRQGRYTCTATLSWAARLG